MSRTRKPTALHQIQGTARPGRLNKNEPKPKANRPKVPKDLDKQTKATFNGLCDVLEEMGVLTVVDGMALELFSSAYTEWQTCNDLIAKDGATYRTTNSAGDEAIKAHPAVAMRADAWKRVRSMMLEYGMTAASRSKVSAIEKEANDPLEAYLSRKPAAPASKIHQRADDETHH